jgi:hypothetical protein
LVEDVHTRDHISLETPRKMDLQGSRCFPFQFPKKPGGKPECVATKVGFEIAVLSQEWTKVIKMVILA